MSFMMTTKDLICYIPFYDGSPKAYGQLEETIKSLIEMSANLNLVSIHLFYCQPEIKERINWLGSLTEKASVQFEPRLFSLAKPVLLPTATYRFMQTDGRSDDFCFYTEADHIVRIEPGFIHQVFQETQKGNVVMPHRVGTFWMDKKKEPCRWGKNFVGNYADPGIHQYTEFFEVVTRFHNAYAGAYFAQRSVIQKHQLSFPLTTNIYWRGFAEYARRFSGGRLFGSQAPYGLLLEAPSSVFDANGQRVLKPHHVKDLHVFHLSQNGGI